MAATLVWPICYVLTISRVGTVIDVHSGSNMPTDETPSTLTEADANGNYYSTGFI